MKRLGICLILLACVSTGHSKPGQSPLFVSTEWLAQHLNEPGVTVLQVGFSRPEFQLGHIPGARFLWFDWLAISTPDLSTEMPPLTHADSVLEMLGITGNSTIVLCFTGTNITTTTRMLLAFTYFGIGDHVSVLDGGLDRWKAEKRPLSSETDSVRRTSLTLHTQPSCIVSADWVKSNLDNPAVAIVDARDKRFYGGNGGGVARTGHIKGAISIPFSSCVDSTGRAKDAGTLQKLFDDAGVKKGMRVVTYCHVGQQATLVYAIARSLGYDAAVYDGSFQEWNVRGDAYPVEKPPAADR
jgi:thiosulfate/3-mercaptopyruvate sulfurtransferase